MNNINVSLNEMDTVIAKLGTHVTNISDKSSYLKTKVGELNGRDWNEETGKNITNTLEEASASIIGWIENINSMKTALQQIRNNYAEQYEAYRSEN